MRRVDVTGFDGLRLAAWEFTDQPKERTETGRTPVCCCSTA